MEYTRDLGYCAAKYLLAGGNARDDLDAGRPLRADPVRGAARSARPAARASAWSTSRSTRYAIARRYMIRLRRDDFDDPHELAKFAATAASSLQEFRQQFEYLIASEPPPFRVSPLQSTATR